MEVSITSVIYTAVLVFVFHKLCDWLNKYITQLQTARKVTGFPNTRMIQGDIVFETFDEYIDMTLDLVHRTKCKINVVWVYFVYSFYTVTHPETAKIILKSSSVPKGSSISSPYIMLQPWIGEGILSNIGGKKWERNRHLLTPAFHFDILKNYTTIFNSVADDLLIHLSQGRDNSLEICGAVKVATLDALLRCAFSYEGRVQEFGFDHPYVAAVQELADIVVKRISSPLTYPDFIFNRTRLGKRFYTLCDYVHKFADDIIASRKQAIMRKDKEENDECVKRYPDFLDILLMSRDEEGRGLSDTEIRAEADTFLFAGHDTTSSAISFAIYALAKYPDVQEQVYKEVMEVIGNRPVEWNDLPALKYMLCFIKEVMRMYSIVPLIGRELTEPLEIDGVVIPAGRPIEINIHAINHRPDVWPDHEEFRPERFQEDVPDRDPFSYIPFSAGNRNCIGQNFALIEQKVILSRLVQTFRIDLDRAHDVQLQMALIMHTKSGIKVFLRSRR